MSNKKRPHGDVIVVSDDDDDDVERKFAFDAVDDSKEEEEQPVRRRRATKRTRRPYKLPESLLKYVENQFQFDSSMTKLAISEGVYQIALVVWLMQRAAAEIPIYRLLPFPSLQADSIASEAFFQHLCTCSLVVLINVITMGLSMPRRGFGISFYRLDDEWLPIVLPRVYTSFEIRSDVPRLSVYSDPASYSEGLYSETMKTRSLHRRTGCVWSARPSELFLSIVLCYYLRCDGKLTRSNFDSVIRLCIGRDSEALPGFLVLMQCSNVRNVQAVLPAMQGQPAFIPSDWLDVSQPLSLRFQLLSMSLGAAHKCTFTTTCGRREYDAAYEQVEQVFDSVPWFPVVLIPIVMQYVLPPVALWNMLYDLLGRTVRVPCNIHFSTSDGTCRHGRPYGSGCLEPIPDGRGADDIVMDYLADDEVLKYIGYDSKWYQPDGSPSYYMSSPAAYYVPMSPVSLGAAIDVEEVNTP